MCALYIHFEPSINQGEINDIGRHFRANLQQRTELGLRKVVLRDTYVLMIDGQPSSSANVGKYTITQDNPHRCLKITAGRRLINLNALSRVEKCFLVCCSLVDVKALADRTQFCNVTRFFDFQKQIKPPTPRIFATNVHEIA